MAKAAYLRAFLGILMLPIVICEDTPDVTLISRKNDYYNSYEMTCIVGETSMNSAIAWIVEDRDNHVSEYIPARDNGQNCNIGENEWCDKQWTTDKTEWNFQRSLRSTLPPVTDRRWEEFKTIYTDGSKSFEQLAYIDNSMFFKIHFSIRMKQDAHLYLCDNYSPRNGKCYWILLAAWGGSKTAIRKCTAEKVNPNSYPQGECKTLRDEMEHASDEMLDENEWRHFTIEKNASNLLLWTMGKTKPILNYVDDRPAMTVTRLIIRSQGSAGYWKLHDYSYTYTTTSTTAWLGPSLYVYYNKLCISIFVAMCDQCNLKLEVTSSNKDEIVDSVIVKPKQAMAWQEVKIIFNILNARTYIQLRVTSMCSTNNCSYPFWAIDNFQVCSENELRQLTIWQENGKTPCQVIKYPSWYLMATELQSQSPPETNCSAGTFGKSCTQCERVFGSDRPNCEKSSICNLQPDGQSVCRCASGYTGKSCTEKCHEDWYGFECKERCGYCRNKPCNYVTGDCNPPGCSTNKFTGSTCKTPSLPVFQNPPTVLKVGHTSCLVQIQNNSFEGTGTPSYYKFQYKNESQTTWSETAPYYFTNTAQVEINHLNIVTNYTIRAILFTKNDKVFDSQYVKNTTFATTCAAIGQKDIKIELFNTSAILTFEHDSESCRPRDYHILLNQERELEVKTFNFTIDKLQPFTDYELTMQDVWTDELLKTKFRTKEGAPDVVKNFRKTNADTNSISISWNPPDIKNGNIKHYNIKCIHKQFLACGTDVSSNDDSSIIIEEESTNTVINNLKPYSTYLIEIMAVTIMDGKSTVITVNTTETESPEKAEIPTVTKVEVTNSTAKILLQQPKCELMKGRVEYFITPTCSNEWCDRYPVTNLTVDNWQVFVIPNLLPYSNYTVNIKVGRKNGNYFGTDVTEMFNTKEGVPNKITNFTAYSKNDSTISLRFSPPFPPTGEIEKYIVKYCEESYSYKCYIREFKPKSCKLWANLECLVINQLKYNIWYKVDVSAKNIGTDFNRPTVIKHIRTIQEAPGAPENLTFTWDDYYNLTLSWIHPSITNGPLTEFGIRILKSNFSCLHTHFHVDEDNYEIQYKYTIPIASECFSSELTIYTSAFNVMEGLPATLYNVVSPPKTPSLQNQPSVDSATNTTVVINLPTPINLVNDSLMYIVVSDTTIKSKVASTEEEIPEIWNKLDLPKHSSSWIAGEFDLKIAQTKQQLYTIGNNTQLKSMRLNKGLQNRALSGNTTYVISIVLINNLQNFTRFRVYKIPANTLGDNSNQESLSMKNGLFALLLLLILVPVIIWIVIRKNKKNISNVNWFAILPGNGNLTHNVSNPDVIPLTTNSESKPSTATVQPQLRPKRKLPENGNPQVPTTSTANEKFSKAVKITEFEQYVKESIANGVLEKQHELFPRGQTKPWDYGLLPQNKSKNRYNNLVAYDHTRVKLQKINNDPYSDYINANYIDGYKSPRAYIATQGPKVATVNDFWRMIWQENVGYIVMLANVIEGGKKKSEQYWPNVGECLKFGNIKVQYVSSRVFADYEYRTFSVSSDNVERQVEQLHFTSWPDHGVPLYSQSLVPFLHKLLTIPQETSPIVVHCSAGVGRTGTIILCDLCLRMAAREGVVDVLKHQHNLREQRPNLVDNLEQYKLAHLVLLECLIAPETNITCDEKMEDTISQLLNSGKVAQQLEYLTETAWQDQAMRPPMEVTAKPEWSAKNRFENITPSGYGRVYLARYPVTDEHSDYINAVEVDGFREPEKFIVTQQPLPHTISDFWRMIDEKEVTTIVSLNKINLGDETSCVFWPTAKVSEIMPVPFISLQFHNKSNNDYYSVITMLMYNKNNKNTKRTVNLIILKTWPTNNLIPDTGESLLKLWEETEKISRGNNPIVVTCYDGAKACGLFTAFSFIVEEIKLEQQCNVCLAVRTVRRNRNQFVVELEQFVFLYKAAINYLSCFDLYSNFTPSAKK